MSNPIARNASAEDQFAFIVAACERLHRRQQELTPENLNAEIPDLSLLQCRKLLESERLAEGLAARGITFRALEELSAHQMHALAIYADTSVPMTHRERLRNARVTQAQWDGWMRNPRFAARLEQIAEDRLAGSTANAHLKLMEAIDRGERWAIELAYEMTGRHRRNQDGQNPAELFAALFEILDEAGVPQETMQAIGRRFRQLAAPGSAPARVATHILAPTGQQAASITSLEE